MFVAVAAGLSHAFNVAFGLLCATLLVDVGLFDARRRVLARSFGGAAVAAA